MSMLWYFGNASIGPNLVTYIYIYVVHNNLWVLVSGLLSVRHEVCVFTSYKYTNIQKFLGLDKIRTRRMW